MQISKRIRRMIIVLLILTLNITHGLKILDELLHFKENIIQGVKNIFKKDDDCGCPCRDYSVSHCETTYVQKCHQAHYNEVCESVPVYVTHKEKVTECQKCKKYYETVPVTKWVTECNPVYDEKCHTKYLSHCSSETRCVMIYQTICKTGYDGYGQHCTNEPRNHCYPETKCHKTPQTNCVPIKKESCSKVQREVTEQQERSQCLPFERSQATVQSLADQNSCPGSGFEAIGSDGSLINAGYGDHVAHYGPDISSSGTGPSGYLAPSATGTGLGGGYSAPGPSVGGNHLIPLDYGQDADVNLFGNGISNSVTGAGYDDSNTYSGHDSKQPRRKQPPHLNRPRDVPLGPGGASTGTRPTVKQNPLTPTSGLRGPFPLTGGSQYPDSHAHTGSDQDNPFLRPTNLGPEPTLLTGPVSDGITNPSSPSSDGMTNSLYPVLASYPTGGQGPFSELSAYGAPKDLKSRPTIVSSPGFNPNFFNQGLGSTHYTPSGTGFAPPSDDNLFVKGTSGPISSLEHPTPPPISGSGSGSGISSTILTGYQIDASDGYGITRQIKGLTDSLYDSFDEFMHPKTQLKRENKDNPDPLTLTNPFLRRHKATKNRRRKLNRRKNVVGSFSVDEDDEILGWIPINPPMV
ncbi:uncharacterized protein LOC131888954 isoform X2 [Tigriopus californicus]|uniref:uncharacterized protein LOC131888954 isoform X2 n=1 Tax=Tigriopus californicus TaxID=6832 RepID=UPI0027DA7E7E|nr:uncharacterized protein LOC131888954 isoform X2 [Tigriopus californicus]